MATANDFPLNPIPGTLAELEKEDGTTVIYKYDADDVAWKIVGQNGGTSQYITTSDVNTTADPPVTPAGWTGFKTQDDLQYLTDQKLVNWFLAEQIIKNHNRPPIINPDEPTEHPELPNTPDLINGDVWVDSNNNIYIYLNGEWIGIVTTDDFVADQLRQDNSINELTQYLQSLIDSGSQLEDIFVKKIGGDSMEGPLDITGGRNADPDTGVQSSIKVLNVDSGGSSSLNLKHNGNTKIYVGDQQSSFAHNIKFSQEDKYVYAGDDTDKKGLAFDSDGVEYFGDYTEDKHVATKLNVEEAIYHDVLDPDTNKYVDRSGDSMTGQLQFTGIDDGKNMIRADRGSGEFPVLLDLKHNNTVGATLGGYDIKIGGSTSYNQLRFVGQDTYLSINGGGGSSTPVKFHKDVDCGNNLFKKLGTPIDETDAANKKYVDDRDEQLRQDIIELEEEIDAIAPSVEYGTWVWKNPSSLGRPPLEGEFYLLDDAFATTQEYANTKHIVIHDDEYGGTGNHSWLEADPGKLIQLFDAADPDFLLGEITNTDTRSGHVIITVDLIQTNGTPADTVDSETGEFLTRINIFEKPSGGDASGFVLKTGDDMSGALKFNNNQDTFSYDVNDAKAKISFVNKTSGGTTQTSHIYQAGDLNTLVTNADLRTRKAIYVDNTIFGWNGSGSGTTTNPRIVLGNSNGELKWGTNKILQWNSGKVESFGKLTINVPQPSSNDNSFVIQGRRYKEGTSILEDNVLLKDYRREITSTLPDYIAYYGDGGGDYEIANKKYVDSKALPSGGSKGQVLKKDHATGNTQWQGAIDINPDGNNRAKGEMWFNQNDGTLYLKVS